MTQHQTKQPEIKKDSVIGGAINAVINGLIYWFSNNISGNIMITGDAISSTEKTVMSGAVPLAVSLAFMLTSISYFTWKLPGKPPYFPLVFKMALKHSIFAFGLVVIFAVLFQRIAGSIYVSQLTASVITGIVAGVAGGIVSYLTNSELLNHAMRDVRKSE
ncbi:MAG: hypothetical protein K1X85_02500 [Ignavibacteria bacterium]|nr:hypothetical protein [Ignavibacteria bacterium]